MFIILGVATVYMFFLKLPHIAPTNFLRERTDSIVISSLPRRGGGSNFDIIENDSDRMDALLSQSENNR